MAEQVYGIDLGTTNSCIAVLGDDGLPEVVKNLEDKYTTPSVIFYDDSDSPVVGEEAKSSMRSDISRSVAFIKREMSNKNYVQHIGDIDVTPIDASALILKKVIDDANQMREYEGLEPIHKAVITVPAYFGDNERKRTEAAAKIAGIEVLGLLNEPTAAALSYGSKKMEDKTFLIYDLGGGTFDVSIMKIKDGKLETIASDGDHHLGGVDWDIALIDLALALEDLDVTYDDIKNSKDIGKLLIAAENCKKNLSKSDKAQLRFMYQRKQHVLDISRSVFEEMTADLVSNTVEIVEHAKSLASEPIDKIDEIILVGGSSYMPMIQNRLMKEYPGCKIRLDMFEPDRAVAKGAAIYASQLESGVSQQVELKKDIGTRSYGVLCVDDDGKSFYVSNLILRSYPMVYSGTSTLFTASEGQTSARISVYENLLNTKIVDEDKCTRILSEELVWGHEVPQGTEVSVVVHRDANGIISLSFSCGGQNIDIRIEGEGAMSKAEIENERKRLEKIRL